MKTTFRIAMMLAVAFTAAAHLLADNDEKSDDEAKDRYAILVERNIFVRNRRPAPSRPLRPVRQPEPEVKEEKQEPRPAPEPIKESTYFVIEGLAIQGDEHVAFLRDTRSNEMQKVNIGDPAANGVIADIDLDSVQFESDGEMKRIEIGHTLAGVYVPVKLVKPYISRNSSSSSSSSRSSSRYSRSRGGSGDDRGGFDRGGFDRGGFDRGPGDGRGDFSSRGDFDRDRNDDSRTSDDADDNGNDAGDRDESRGAVIDVAGSRGGDDASREEMIRRMRERRERETSN